MFEEDDFMDSDEDFDEAEHFEDTPLKPEDNDFNRQIIRLVQEYPILFDRSHKLFFHKKANDKAWNDIGQRLGRSGMQCQKAYRSLYTRFGIHHVMVSDPEYTARGWPKKDFPYYQNMIFLMDHFHFVRAKRRVKMITRYDMRHRYAGRREEKMMKMIQKKMGWNMGKKGAKKARKAKKMSANPPPPTEPSLSIEPSPGPFSAPIPPSMTGVHQNFLALPQDHDFSEDISLDNFHDNWSEAEPEAPKCVTPPKPKGPPLKAAQVDFFFNSVSQQVIRSRLSSTNFSDLKSSILTALSEKLPN